MKLGRKISDKIYMEMIAECYDKITDNEALQYYNIYDEFKVKCDSSRIKEMIPCNLLSYKNWKSEKDLKPTLQQYIIFNAYKVLYI